MKPAVRATVRFALALGVVTTLGPGVAWSQTDRPGPWVPLGSRLDRFAVWALDEGAFKNLDPLTRPFRLAALRRAVREQDTVALPAAGRRAVQWVTNELDGVADSVSLVGEVALMGYTNGRRDSFRTSDSGGIAPAAGMRATLVRGPFVAVLNPAVDNRLKDDPEYTGYTRNFIAGRNQEAYVAATGDIGDLFYGRMARNWGPSLFDGLLVSPSAYPIEEFAGALRIGRFELQSINQRLDDLTDSTSAVPIQRWLLAHRLTINAGRGVWLSFTETGVYGGRGQGFDPVFAAPLNLALLSGFNDGRRVNTLVGVDARFSPARAWHVALAGYLDDIQIDRATLTDQRPTAYGLTADLTWALPVAPAHVHVGYTRVSALSYRDSFRPDLQYSLRGIGLARNYSDYDQLLVRVETHPAAAWAVSFDLSYLRQGADDFRQPFPSDSLLATPGQGFLVSPVHSAPGVRMTVDAELRPGLEVRGELGATRTLAGSGVLIAALAGHVRFDLLKRALVGGFPAIEAGASRGWP